MEKANCFRGDGTIVVGSGGHGHDLPHSDLHDPLRNSDMAPRLSLPAHPQHQHQHCDLQPASSQAVSSSFSPRKRRSSLGKKRTHISSRAAAVIFSHLEDEATLSIGNPSSIVVPTATHNHHTWGTSPSIASSSDATFGSIRYSGALSNTNINIKTVSQKKCSSQKKLEQYITHKKWSKLRTYLTTEEGAFNIAMHVHVQHVASASNKQKEENNSLNSHNNMNSNLNQSTLLHVACQGHPPLDIVQTLCAVHPAWMWDTGNQHKHTPLHVAATWGAHPHVVQFLVQQAPQCASWTDAEGRTPLHLHCLYCCDTHTCDPDSFTHEEHQEHRAHPHPPSHQCGLERGEQDDHDYTGVVDMLDSNMLFAEMIHAHDRSHRTYGPVAKVVMLLHQASPRSINQEDSNGMNPIEYCLVHGVGRVMMVHLQRLSVTEWRLQQQEQHQDASQAHYHRTSIVPRRNVNVIPPPPPKKPQLLSNNGDHDDGDGDVGVSCHDHDHLYFDVRRRRANRRSSY
jgi:hypothetical protein